MSLIIPNELVIKIFSYFERDSLTLFKLSLVNRKFANLAIPFLWKNLLSWYSNKPRIKIIPFFLRQLPEKIWKELELSNFLPDSITANNPLFNYASYLKSLSTSYVVSSLVILLKNKIIEEKSPEKRTFIVEKILAVARAIFQLILESNRIIKLEIEDSDPAYSPLLEERKILTRINAPNSIETEVSYSIWEETFLYPLNFQNTNLKHLYITLKHAPVNSIVTSREIKVPNLQKLEVYTTKISELQLQKILISSGKSLKLLSIHTRSFHPETIQTIAKNCQNLCEIKINHGTSGFDLEKLTPIFQNCQSLRIFCFWVYGEESENLQPYYTLHKILQLFSNNNNLLDLYITSSFHEEDVINFFNTCQLNLRSFVVRFSGDLKRVYEAFEKFKNRKKNPIIEKISLFKSEPKREQLCIEKIDGYDCIGCYFGFNVDFKM